MPKARTVQTVERHGGRVENVLILEVEVPRSWLRRNRRPLWYSTRTSRPVASGGLSTSPKWPATRAERIIAAGQGRGTRTATRARTPFATAAQQPLDFLLSCRDRAVLRFSLFESGTVFRKKSALALSLGAVAAGVRNGERMRQQAATIPQPGGQANQRRTSAERARRVRPRRPLSRPSRHTKEQPMRQQHKRTTAPSRCSRKESVGWRRGRQGRGLAGASPTRAGQGEPDGARARSSRENSGRGVRFHRSPKARNCVRLVGRSR